MIKVRMENEEVIVEVAGSEIEVLDSTDDYIIAECKLDQLKDEVAAEFPDGLHLQVQSEDGFNTFFFHESILSRADQGVSLQFRCHTPNKYWEGQFGLATFLAAVRDQVRFSDGWQ